MNFHTLRSKAKQLLLGLTVLGHVFFFSYWYASETGAFETSYKMIKVKTVAYDPRDLLSGQYIRLTYEFSRLNQLNNASSSDWSRMPTDHNNRRYLTKGDFVWVKLEQTDGYFHPTAIYQTRPDKNMFKNNVIIKGSAKRYNRIEYGIERYFVKEGTKEPNRNDVTVALKVYPSGKVRIDQLYVKNKLWP